MIEDLHGSPHHGLGNSSGNGQAHRHVTQANTTRSRHAARYRRLDPNPSAANNSPPLPTAARVPVVGDETIASWAPGLPPAINSTLHAPPPSLVLAARTTGTRHWRLGGPASNSALFGARLSTSQPFDRLPKHAPWGSPASLRLLAAPSPSPTPHRLLPIRRPQASSPTRDRPAQPRACFARADPHDGLNLPSRLQHGLQTRTPARS